MKREVALAWLDQQPIEIEEAFYITAEDDQHDHSMLFCPRHGQRAAHALTILRGVVTYYSGAWAGSDNEEWCVICGVALDAGGLTDAGVDSALALTEEHPFRSPIAIEGLVLAAQAMMNDDPRWSAFCRHVDRLRRRQRRPP